MTCLCVCDEVSMCLSLVKNGDISLHYVSLIGYRPGVRVVYVCAEILLLTFCCRGFGSALASGQPRSVPLCFLLVVSIASGVGV